MTQFLLKRQIQTYRNKLINCNYTEDPVDVLTFLSDNNYLGTVTKQGKDIYPIWRSALAQMFDDGSKHIIVLTGSTGTGKSTIAIYALLYIQYRLMILKDAWKFFSIGYSGQLSMSFFNLNRTLSNSRGYSKMQAYMVESPWFRKNARYIHKNREKEELEFKLIKYLLASPASQGYGVIGEDVVAGILSEVDTPDATEAQKKGIIEVYSAVATRFKNRFALTGYSLGKLFIDCSKQDEGSFVDTFIAERKTLPEVLIFDYNVWQAKPPNTFSGVTFPVAIGDSYNPPKMVPIITGISIEQQLPEFCKFSEEYLRKGFTIKEIPIEFKSMFQLDLLRSLRDVAGITVAGLRRSKLFGNVQFISDCFDLTKQDPLKLATIEIGLKDPDDLIWYMDLAKIRMSKEVPRCIHLDISFSHDATGIAMSGIKDWKQINVENPDGTFREEMVPIIETDFVMRLKAKQGDRIPIHKIRKLVLDLRAAGFNIVKFSSDLQLASEDTIQILTQAGIESEIFSLDKKNQGYFDFRNLVCEKRWICHNHSLLYIELKNLEQSALDGKVDHPDKVIEKEYFADGTFRENVFEGTKDISDAVAGSVVQCLYSKKVPMNVQLMTNLIKQATTVNSDPTENIRKLVQTPEGVEIQGTKHGDHLNKINDIFRRMHNR